MRCQKCDYALWHLPPGRCPECGEPFKPSQFRFPPGKVNYLCPHCEQPYEAPTPDAQPTPEPFACVKCGEMIQIDQMLVTPAPGVPAREAEAISMPWLDRQRLGWWKGFWRTVGWSLARPSDVINNLPAGAGVWAALEFAFCVAAFVAFVGVLVSIVFWSIMFGVLGGIGGTGVSPGMMLFPMLTGFGCLGLGIILWPLLGVGLWALMAHFLLVITGKRAGGLALTYRAMLYGQGPLVLQAVPVCGSYIAWVWLAVSSTIMVKRSQEVSGLRAAFAVLAPPVSFVALYLGVVLWIFSNAMLTGPGAWPGGAPARSVSTIGSALVNNASPWDGAGPEHILELVAAGELTMRDLADPQGVNAYWAYTQLGEWTRSEERR
ncbi:MAG: hypothetical protein ACF8NJ_09095, partial [Phycisphaerales bacterium JB038]